MPKWPRRPSERQCGAEPAEDGLLGAVPGLNSDTGQLKHHSAVAVLPTVFVCKSNAVTEGVLGDVVQDCHHRS